LPVGNIADVFTSRPGVRGQVPRLSVADRTPDVLRLDGMDHYKRLDGSGRCRPLNSRQPAGRTRLDVTGGHDGDAW
jgi:hypothetical protein